MEQEFIDLASKDDKRASATPQMRRDAEEFDDLCRRAGWSGREVARRLSITDKTVRQWSSCARPMPPQVLPWLRRIVHTMEAQGLPEDWRHGRLPEHQDAHAI